MNRLFDFPNNKIPPQFFLLGFGFIIIVIIIVIVLSNNKKNKFLPTPTQTSALEQAKINVLYAQELTMQAAAKLEATRNLTKSHKLLKQYAREATQSTKQLGTLSTDSPTLTPVTNNVE